MQERTVSRTPQPIGADLNVPAQVAEHLFRALHGRFAIDHPLGGPDRLGNAQIGALLTHESLEEPSEEIGERPHRHEVGLASRLPLGPVTGDPTGRDQAVDMRVVAVRDLRALPFGAVGRDRFSCLLYGPPPSLQRCCAKGMWLTEQALPYLGISAMVKRGLASAPEVSYDEPQGEHTDAGSQRLRRTDGLGNGRPQDWRRGTAVCTADGRWACRSVDGCSQHSGSHPGVHSRHLVTELPQATGAVAKPCTRISWAEG
jgi:hypothetical protein